MNAARLDWGAGVVHSAPVSGRDWKMIGDAVVAGRIKAGYRTRPPFAQALGISERTIGNLERGQSVRADTLRAVETLLGWEAGHLDKLPPTPLRHDVLPQASSEGGRADDGVPVDEDGRPWTPERIWAVLEFVRRNTEDPLAWYRALYDAAQKWGIPPSASNQSRQAG